MACGSTPVSADPLGASEVKSLGAPEKGYGGSSIGVHAEDESKEEQNSLLLRSLGGFGMKPFVWLFAILTVVSYSLSISMADPEAQATHKIRIRVEQPPSGHANYGTDARDLQELREFLQSHCVSGAVKLGYITQGSEEPSYEGDAVAVNSLDDNHFKWLTEKTEAGESRFIQADQFDQSGKCQN